jgi:ion channel POLLUX/CASTOR
MAGAFGEKFRYRFENFMSKGGVSIFISLTVLFTVCLLVALGLRWLVVTLVPGLNEVPLPDHFWNTFLAMTDPGNMGVDEQPGVWLRATVIVAGFLGVVIFSMLIAFITTSLDSLLHEFRKGRSRVVEKGQTVILGWSDRVMDIIKQLTVANESESDACIVLLAEKDKEEMEDEISTFLPDLRTTRVICRNGHTSTIANLKRVNACEAKSAIVLASCPETAVDDDKRVSDAKVIKTVLALVACQEDGKNQIPIVAELYFQDSRDVLATMDDPQIVCMNAREMLGKIMVQTSRTSGLAVVYNEVLGYEGSEMYLTPQDWKGIRFYDALYHFPDGVLLGIERADGKLEIRPAADAVLNEGDKALIICEDNSTIDFKPAPLWKPADHPFQMRRLEKSVEHELLLGWHGIANTVVSEYADYLLEGSSINIVVHHPSDKIKGEVQTLAKECPTLKIRLIDRNPMDLEQLRSLKPFAFNNVFVLSQSEDPNPEKTDSETVVILMLLRKILRDAGLEKPKMKLITQILDSENQDLISQTNVDDFIISNKLASMILAQLSEAPAIKRIYDDLFSEEGSEVYLKPVELYFTELPVEVPFLDCIGQALKREEICFGYRLGALSTNPERNFGVKVNPDKQQKLKLQKGDSLVVLAEDEL